MIALIELVEYDTVLEEIASTDTVEYAPTLIQLDDKLLTNTRLVQNGIN